MPQFLLPETNAEYERIWDEANAANQVILENLQAKEKELRLQAVALHQEYLYWNEKSFTCEAEKVLNIRRANKKLDEEKAAEAQAVKVAAIIADDLWKVVQLYLIPADFNPAHPNQTNYKKNPIIFEWAEEQARKAEREKIVAGAEVILTEQPAEHMRQLLRYEGRFFVCELTKSLNYTVEGCVETEVKWMNEALEQMSDEELEKIVELSQPQPKA